MATLGQLEESQLSDACFHTLQATSSLSHNYRLIPLWLSRFKLYQDCDSDRLRLTGPNNDTSAKTQRHCNTINRNYDQPGGPASSSTPSQRVSNLPIHTLVTVSPTSTQPPPKCQSCVLLSHQSLLISFTWLWQLACSSLHPVLWRMFPIKLWLQTAILKGATFRCVLYPTCWNCVTSMQSSSTDICIYIDHCRERTKYEE